MKDNIDVKIKNIKNTFLPNCRNEWLSINDIISLLKKGFCSLDSLPEKVEKNVVIIIEQRTVRRNSISKDTLKEMK